MYHACHMAGEVLDDFWKFPVVVASARGTNIHLKIPSLLPACCMLRALSIEKPRDKLYPDFQIAYIYIL